jgi:phage nucleotide-binding protein
MGLIKKPNELTQSKIKLKGLIYGQPGVGKTSLALSVPKPLLIDFDNGLRRVAKQYQTDSVQIESYQNLIDILEKEDISNYETIVIDTLGKVIDRMGDWLALSNPKLKQSDGQLSQKGWGSIKGEFQRLLKLLEGKNKSVIFVSHEKEEKVDDKVNKRIDVSGSTGKDVIKELDFVGYMSIQGGKRTIDLSPNDNFFTKNSLGISSFYEYKPLTGVNNFLSQAIFEAYTNKLAQDELLIIEYNNVIAELQNKIDNIKNAEDLNLYYSSIYNKHDKLWSSYEMEANFLKIKSEELLKAIDKVETLNSFYNDIYLPMKDLAIDKLLLKTKSEELGCEFDKKSKEFVSNKKEVKND